MIELGQEGGWSMSKDQRNGAQERLSLGLLARCWLLIFGLALLMSCDRQIEDDVYETVLGPGVTPSALAERWQVINYWATWCGPCITEIPELNELARDHAGTLVVLGVDFDAPVESAVARAAIEKMGIEFPVLAFDPSPRLGLSMPEVLPTTVLVNPKGEVHQGLVGPQTKGSILESMGLRERL